MLSLIDSKVSLINLAVTRDGSGTVPKTFWGSRGSRKKLAKKGEVFVAECMAPFIAITAKGRISSQRVPWAVTVIMSRLFITPFAPLNLTIRLRVPWSGQMTVNLERLHNSLPSPGGELRPSVRNDSLPACQTFGTCPSRGDLQSLRKWGFGDTVSPLPI